MPVLFKFEGELFSTVTKSLFVKNLLRIKIEFIMSYYFPSKSKVEKQIELQVQ